MSPFWFVITAGTAVSSVLFLIAMWRWMRAHEQLAHHVGQMVEVLREQHSE